MAAGGFRRPGEIYLCGLPPLDRPSFGACPLDDPFSGLGVAGAPGSDGEVSTDHGTQPPRPHFPRRALQGIARPEERGRKRERKRERGEGEKQRERESARERALTFLAALYKVLVLPEEREGWRKT